MGIEANIKQEVSKNEGNLVNFNKYKLIETINLVKADWNYKEEDAEKTKKLTENIKRNGQIENLIVRELETGYFEVCNGNHRLDVFKTLNMDKVVCYNLGKISAQEAKRKAIETNETKFPVDNIKLAETMKDLLSVWGVSDLAKTMPYTENEITSLDELTDFDFDQFDKEEESGEKKTKEHTCPECGHVWEE